MKRDMEIIRRVLMNVEETTPPHIHLNGIEAQHAEILIEGGYLDGRMENRIGVVVQGAFINRLTWEGHELLDSIRNDTIWERTKEKVLKPGASWTVAALAAVAKAEVMKQLGLP